MHRLIDLFRRGGCNKNEIASKFVDFFRVSSLTVLYVKLDIQMIYWLSVIGNTFLPYHLHHNHTYVTDDISKQIFSLKICVYMMNQNLYFDLLS